MEGNFLSAVSVVYGPLSGWELWMWQCFIWILGPSFALLLGTTESLDVLERYIPSSSVRCRWFSLLVVGYSTGMEGPCFKQAFKVKTNSHPWSFLPNLLASSLENLSSDTACFLKVRISTLNLIHNSGEKLFSCTSLRWKSSLQLLRPGFEQPNFT